jgi:hypothetical protein
MDSQVKSNIGVFANALRRIMERTPVGFAMEFFSRRYTELAAEYAGLLQETRAGKVDDEDEDLNGLKIAFNDAKNYIVIGDPAVRIVPGYQVNGRTEGDEVSHAPTDRPLVATDPGRGPESDWGNPLFCL